MLSKCEYTQSASDLCLFVARMKNSNVYYLLVYLNDIIIAGVTKLDCEFIVRQLSKQFEISKMEPAHFFLGIKIERDRNIRSLCMSQHAYITKMLSRFELEGTSSNVPMKSDLHLRKASIDEQKASLNLPFRELVGCLMYLACTTRTDIMYAVSRLARYFSCYE